MNHCSWYTRGRQYSHIAPCLGSPCYTLSRVMCPICVCNCVCIPPVVKEVVLKDVAIGLSEALFVDTERGRGGSGRPCYSVLTMLAPC